MKKGSITVFSAMSMMLIASLLFALLESARYYGLRLMTNQKSVLVTESLFAEYNTPLWRDYHVLLLDGAYGGEEFSTEKAQGVALELLDDNLNYDLTYLFLKRMNLYQMEATGVTVDGYQLATDGGGDVFLNYVASYMKENIPVEAAQTIYDRIQRGQEIGEEYSGSEGAVEDAVEGMKAKEADTVLEGRKAVQFGDKVQKAGNVSQSVEKSYKTAAKENVTAENAKEESVTEESVTEEESVLDYVLKLKQNAVLGMVTEEGKEVSEKTLTQEGSLFKRELEQGTMEVDEEPDWYAKILFELYLTNYFSDYTKESKNRALDYELEYFICGKETDRGNLDGVVERLMLAREAGNVASILMDASKVNEALILATALAGATVNPTIIKAVQIGIIGAWAYLESILDIRALLQGEKIALVKTAAEWTTNVGNIISSFNKTKTAKNCVNGLTYQDYLMQFLFFVNGKKLSCRAMNLMEQNLHLEPGYENVKMDHMIVTAKVSYEYGGDSLFWKLIVLEGSGDFSYSFQNTQIFSYQIE